MNDAVMILTTGGTIDKQYFDSLSKYKVAESTVSKMLRIARVPYPHIVVECMRKDSLEMTPIDRTEIARRVLEACRAHHYHAWGGHNDADCGGAQGDGWQDHCSHRRPGASPFQRNRCELQSRHGLCGRPITRTGGLYRHERFFPRRMSRRIGSSGRSCSVAQCRSSDARSRASFEFAGGWLPPAAGVF
jgi:Asparaginase, N-terminal